MFRPHWVCSRCLDVSRRLTSSPVRPFRRYLSTDSTSILSSLVTRARSIQKRHLDLIKQLEASYDSKLSKKAGELSRVVEALRQWDKANDSISELNSLLADSQTDPELRELASQDITQANEDLSKASQSLTESLIPKHPFAQLPCLIEIRPGVGGGEAAIFARDLQRMYQTYCQENGLSCLVLKEDTGSAETEESLQEAILEIETPGAYDILRCEAGVHRVQRVPATESKGRVHTSTAAVMVLPSFPKTSDDIDINDPSSDFYIDPKEIRRDFLRASGAGGQHVNKTESAVRLTHIPTSTTVFIQESRQRANNEEKAWSLLRSRLAASRREQRDEETRRLRRSVIGVAKIGRADKVRTYNWQQQRVTDHRSGVTIHGLDGVMDGGQNLQKIMDSVKQWQMSIDVEDIVTSES